MINKLPQKVPFEHLNYALLTRTLQLQPVEVFYYAKLQIAFGKQRFLSAANTIYLPIITINQDLEKQKTPR
jgi:hypothetical protein